MAASEQSRRGGGSGESITVAELLKRMSQGEDSEASGDSAGDASQRRHHRRADSGGVSVSDLTGDIPRVGPDGQPLSGRAARRRAREEAEEREAAKQGQPSQQSAPQGQQGAPQGQQPQQAAAQGQQQATPPAAPPASKPADKKAQPAAGPRIARRTTTSERAKTSDKTPMPPKPAQRPAAGSQVPDTGDLFGRPSGNGSTTGPIPVPDTSVKGRGGSGSGAGKAAAGTAAAAGAAGAGAAAASTRGGDKAGAAKQAAGAQQTPAQQAPAQQQAAPQGRQGAGAAAAGSSSAAGAPTRAQQVVRESVANQRRYEREAGAAGAKGATSGKGAAGAAAGVGAAGAATATGAAASTGAPAGAPPVKPAASPTTEKPSLFKRGNKAKKDGGKPADESHGSFGGGKTAAAAGAGVAGAAGLGAYAANKAGRDDDSSVHASGGGSSEANTGVIQKVRGDAGDGHSGTDTATQPAVSSTGVEHGGQEAGYPQGQGAAHGGYGDYGHDDYRGHDEEVFDPYGQEHWDDEPQRSGFAQWAILALQVVGAAIAGAALFVAFELLWRDLKWVALALAIVVIIGLVAIVRVLRRGNDWMSIALAVVVGIGVTFGPLLLRLFT